MQKLRRIPLLLCNAARKAINKEHGFRCSVTTLHVYEVAPGHYTAKYRAIGAPFGPAETEEMEVEFHWSRENQDTTIAGIAAGLKDIRSLPQTQLEP